MARHGNAGREEWLGTECRVRGGLPELSRVTPLWGLDSGRGGVVCKLSFTNCILAGIFPGPAPFSGTFVCVQPAQGVSSLAPVRLLLVDDDESVLSGLSAILEAHEFEVTTAPGVIEALKHISSESFDVLLTDLHMPGPGDGLIVVGAMRHANPKCVTLILSANPDMAKATAAILREADEVFLKPVKAAPLVQAIRQRLAQEEQFPRSQVVEAVATVLERERASITQTWLAEMATAGSMAAVPISAAPTPTPTPQTPTPVPTAPVTPPSNS